MQAVLFHNPSAGGGKFTKKELVTALQLGGLNPRYVSTKSKRFKDELAEAEDLIVVAGGDGTVAKVIAQMPDRGVPVAILPLGSANNIARSFGVAGAPYELAEILHPLYWQRYSMGVVRGPWGRRRFVEAVGLGPLARMMKKPSLDVARGIDSLRGGRDEFRKILKKAKPLDIDVLVDGKPLAGEILSLEVMNIIYTGPGLPLAPSADPGDRMLEVVCVRPAERGVMMDWISEPRHRRPPVTVRRGRVVDIVWRGDLIRIDDDVIKAPDSETTITVALERTSARILVPPPRGMRRLWPEMERQMNQRQCGSRANALSRSILRKSSLLKPNSPKPCT
jgi:diacylglycerol kinase (ATP)